MNSRVVIITTSSQTLRSFLQAQILLLKSVGFDIHTISSPGDELDECRANLRIPMHEIAMQRRISPFADAAALVQLVIKLMRLDRKSVV